ncbi:hypothetical protein FRC10_006406 [Ceratobasidium sp. 414]|nr:hypothetical protein FRC10_006406 [Ceratobasidium sp. 414]
MLRSAAILSVGALTALAVPSSPGVCQPYASLSFQFPPVNAPEVSSHVIYNGLTLPRGLRFDAADNMLVIENGLGVTALTQRNDATCAGWEKRTVVSRTDLNHAVELGPGPKRGAVQNQYLYASSQERVFRWEYDPRNAVVLGDPVTLTWNMTNVNPIPPDHVTRTILLEPAVNGASQYMLVTRGASGNWDSSAADPRSGTAQIRRFGPLDNVPAGGWAWQQGKVLAYGLRNGVGIAFSKDGKSLWEVDNGSDNVFWRGVDVHQDNPAEELNNIPLTASVNPPYYGYPNCFTTWNSDIPITNASAPVFNLQPGQQFSVKNPPEMPDDAWCDNPNNVVQPRLIMESHAAPLDLVFYDTSKCLKTANSAGLPNKWNGDAFVSLHGSWDRVPSDGHKVIRIPWAKNQDQPAAPYGSRNGYVTVVSAPDPTNCNGTCIRPVSFAWDKLGKLYVSSDATGEVFVIKDRAAP